jgi:two-component system phosphate regulon response regulator OmpR
MATDSPKKILVVDDDQRLRDLLRRYLADQGFNVFIADNATAMNKLWTRERFDLLVLDLMLPGEDGLSICRRLRGASDSTPIIMLTARGDEVDRFVGLELGADDYLPKPFNPRELVARIHAVLRRRGAPEAPGAPASDIEVFEFGPYSLNLQTRTLTHDDKTRSLTTGEFAVMKAFARHPRQPLSREKLMELARGREYEVFDRSLDVQISRLRKLIEVDPSNPSYIQTVWGLGYVFIPDGPPAPRSPAADETASPSARTSSRAAEDPANDAAPAPST